MKFSYRDTVKWHDTDANRCVRPSRILTYMQEAANLQMAANSRNLDKLLIGKYMSMSDLGYYEKSYRLMMLPLQMTVCFSMTMM